MHRSLKPLVDGDAQLRATGIPLRCNIIGYGEQDIYAILTAFASRDNTVRGTLAESPGG